MFLVGEDQVNEIMESENVLEILFAFENSKFKG